MRNLVHKYEQVVFGTNMHAVMFAYVNQIPLFYFNINKPRIYEFFPREFSFADIENVNQIIVNNEQTIFGMKKVDLWKRLTFMLGYEGLMPLGGNIQSARLEEGLLKVTTNNSRLLKISFEKMHVFDENLQGLPKQVKFNNQGKVFDYFEFLNLNEHKDMIMKTDSDIVNELWIKGKKGIAISNVENIHEDIPDYAIKFAIFDIAKKYDIKGKRNGIYHYRKELKIQRYNKLDFRLNNRVVEKTLLDEYELQNNLEFIDSTPQLESELLSKLKTNRTWNLLLT